jgi:hypothetical protein
MLIGFPSEIREGRNHFENQEVNKTVKIKELLENCNI